MYTVDVSAGRRWLHTQPEMSVVLQPATQRWLVPSSTAVVWTTGARRVARPRPLRDGMSLRMVISPTWVKAWTPEDSMLLSSEAVQANTVISAGGKDGDVTEASPVAAGPTLATRSHRVRYVDTRDDFLIRENRRKRLEAAQEQKRAAIQELEKQGHKVGRVAVKVEPYSYPRPPGVPPPVPYQKYAGGGRGHWGTPLPRRWKNGQPAR